MGRKGKLQGLKSEIIERPVKLKFYDYLFLIVCEDQKTEPAYFEQFVSHFPPKTIYLKPVGVGRDPKGVVEQAIQIKDELEYDSRKEVDFVWVVFDKDDADANLTKTQRFKDAFRISRKNKFKVAYSNEVFELWLLIHLKDVPTNVPIPRSDIYKDLEFQINQNAGYSNFVYEHGKVDIIPVINAIGDEPLAIQRAKVLYEAQRGIHPIDANPSTKVHILVEELRKWIDYYTITP